MTFTAAGDDGESDSPMVTGLGSPALEVGNTTAPIVVRAKVGFTLEIARADFFNHSLFRDFMVKVFAKKRADWIKLGEMKVDRRIIEPAAKAPGAS